MSTLKQKLCYLAATAIPIYLWAKLIQKYLIYKQQTSDIKKNHHKHNCVVTYSKHGGMFGWPEYPERLQLNLDSYNKFLEPILYFLNTAKCKIDVSVMILSCHAVIDALSEAAERGVKIRIILDVKVEDMKQKYKKLTKKGVVIMYDLKSINTDTIMHNKYAVKDYNPSNGTGYSLCGSLNWTQSAFHENYEFMVLSSNRQVVEAFNKNFEESWSFLEKAKETNLVNEKMYQL